MKKQKYTKKQIREAIEHWKTVLEKMDNGGKVDLVAVADELGIDTSMLKGNAQKLDESTGKGFAVGLLAGMLGLCSMGKIANSLDGKFAELADDGQFAKVVHKVDAELSDIRDGLNRIEDALYALTNKIDFNDPSLEDLITPNAADEINAQFEKIMSEP